MDSHQRRSGIPVPKSKTSNLKKNMSKSSDDLLADDSHNQSGDLDLFTLLEENIALKEKIENLLSKNNSVLQKNVQLERENVRLGKQLDELRVQQKLLKDQLQMLLLKFQREMDEGQTIQNIQEQQKKIINDLMLKVRIQEEKHIELLNAGKQAKHKLEQLAPEIGLKNTEASEKCDIVTAETVEQLISEIANMKTQMNNTELQLYEANEKIAELIENHDHLKEENESLKVENSNLTKVAKLMTSSMKESMDTSKRMEEALIQMKKRNDELVRGNAKDAIDSPTTPSFFTTNDQVMQLKDELKRREAVHTERIVEMNKLMETTIQTNTNDEINVLRIKLEVVEKELQFAINRAEKAEVELEQFKQMYRSSSASFTSAHPLPPKPFAQTQHNCSVCGTALTTASLPLISSTRMCKPPPPPPPMPNFNLPPVNFAQGGVSLSDSIAAFTLNNAREIDGDSISTCSSVSDQQVNKPATGMDALIAELRDGSVTLRRNRRKTTNNAALQEMFEMLELSRKQNRNSRIVVESHSSNRTNIVNLTNEQF